MSTTLPRRRLYDGEAVDPEDWNDLVDDSYRALGSLGEHNISSSFRTQVERSDYSDSVACRLATASSGGSSGAVNEVIGGDFSAGLVFQKEETWMDIWTFSWKSSERADIYAMANVQVSTAINRSWVTAPDDQGLDAFKYLDAMNIRLGWILDGVLPGEHVRGSLDLGSAGVNMERGPGGEYNAQEVSALFRGVAAGDNTLRLVVNRASVPDDVQEALRKVSVPLWEAIIWEIRR